MTNEELAKHWNVSLEEAEDISKFINKSYSLHVGKSRKDGLFYGLIYRMDKKHGPMLAVSSKRGYRTSREAVDFINSACDTMQMPEERAELLGVPADAYKALKKIDPRTMASKTQTPNILTGKEKDR